MENLVIVSSNLLDKGAIVNVEVYADEHRFLKHKNTAERQLSVTAKMLIDTGSNISGLDRNLIDLLQLPLYSDKAFVDGAGGMAQLNRYRCVMYMKIFGNKALPLDILEGRFDNSPYDGIIGRDVLRFCHMQYDGPTNCYKLSAPNF